MRRLLRDLLEGKEIHDTSTLADEKAFLNLKNDIKFYLN